MKTFCLLVCVASVLGAVLAEETASTSEREKRQFIAPDGMILVPVPTNAFYDQLPEEMFSYVPTAATTSQNVRNVDGLLADTEEEKAHSAPVEVRQYGPYGPPSYLPFRPRPYGFYGSYGPRPYSPYGYRPRPYGPASLFSLNFG